MKVLMISGDKNVLVEGSEAYARLELQRSAVDCLDVFVWPQVHSWHEITRAAHANKYDMITAQDPFWRGFLAWKIARRIGAKLNLQIHTDLSAQSFARRRLAYFLLRRAGSVRVVSEKIKQQVKHLCVHARVNVLPIFVDIEKFQTAQRKSNSQKTILWIGRFEPEKDPKKAVEVLREVRKDVDAKLIMLGTGSLEQELHTHTQGLPIEFPGWHDPLPYMEVADVVLSTSKHESYGASIIEALSAGVPVVSPDVGIAKEAGAVVVERTELPSAVCDVLHSEKRGELLLSVLGQNEWARRWRETLM